MNTDKIREALERLPLKNPQSTQDIRGEALAELDKVDAEIYAITNARDEYFFNVKDALEAMDRQAETIKRYEEIFKRTKKDMARIRFHAGTVCERIEQALEGGE